MPVLANAQKTQLRLCCLQTLSILAADQLQVGRIPLNFKELSHGHALRQPFAQVAPEGSRMILADAYVFIEVKSPHLLPGNIRSRDQRIKRRQLRSSRRENNRNALVFLFQLLNRPCRCLCRSVAGTRRILMDLDFQSIHRYVLHFSVWHSSSVSDFWLMQAAHSFPTRYRGFCGRTV